VFDISSIDFFSREPSDTYWWKMKTYSIAAGTAVIARGGDVRPAGLVQGLDQKATPVKQEAATL
jgi:hypothetical protein